MGRFFFFTLLLLTTPALTQTGPQIPCPECSTYSATTYPESGWWFNPEQPGTGVNWEVQNGYLLGAYYGYDADGRPEWYLFQGPLAPGDEGAEFFTLEAELQRYTNGNCLNCPFAPPEAGASPGMLTIRFLQRNHAAYSVDGGSEQFIVPLVYGVDAPTHFGDAVAYQFPDLEGIWVFVQENPRFGSFWGKSASVWSISERFVSTEQGRVSTVRYSLGEISGIDFNDSATIECHSDLDAGGAPLVPACRLNIQVPNQEGTGETRTDVPLALGNLGDSRFEVQAENGVLIKAYRVDYD